MDKLNALFAQLGMQVEGLGTETQKLKERVTVFEARVHNLRVQVDELIRALDRRV